MPTIQEAVQAAAPGDVVTIPAGVYDVSNLTLPSDITLRADGDVTIVGNFIVDGANTVVEGFTFEGGKVDLGYSQNAAVRDCVFNGGEASINYSWATGAEITNNDFNNVAGPALDGWEVNEATISGNNFANCWQGINLNFNDNPAYGNDILIEQNSFTNTAWMPIEVGPGGAYTSNLVVRGNWSDNSNVSDPEGGVAYSIISTNGVGTLIEGNYAVGPEGPGIGIEMAGEGQVTGNYVDTFQFGIIAYGDGPFTVADNATINASIESVVNYHGGNGVIENNTTDATGMELPAPPVWSADGEGPATPDVEQPSLPETPAPGDVGSVETPSEPGPVESGNFSTIQEAIQAAAPGDVVTIPAGVYDVSNLTLPSDITLRADGDVTIVGNFIVDGANTVVEGFTFEGGKVDLGYSQNAAVRDCVFNGGEASINYSWATGAEITNNDFNNVAGPALDGWEVNEATISGNNFANCWQGINLNFNDNPAYGNDILIEQNSFTNTAWMPIEVGPGGAYTSNLVVRGNWSDNSTISDDVSEGGVAYSIISTNGVGTLIEGNYALGPDGPGIGIEMAGEGEIRNNYVDTFQFGIIAYGDGPFAVRDNATFNTPVESVLNYHEGNGVIENNTSDAAGIEPPAPPARWADAEEPTAPDIRFAWDDGAAVSAAAPAEEAGAAPDAAWAAFQPFEFSGLLNQQNADQIG